MEQRVVGRDAERVDVGWRAARSSPRRRARRRRTGGRATNASASWSTSQPRARASGAQARHAAPASSGRGVRVGQAAVGEHLLHDHAEAGGVRACERAARATARAVEGRLHDVEHALAVDARLERAARARAPRSAPLSVRPTARYAPARRPATSAASSASSVEAARLRGRAVDLVEVEPRAERARGSRRAARRSARARAPSPRAPARRPPSRRCSDSPTCCRP